MKEEEDDPESTNEIMVMQYLKNANLLVAVNGDQNAFVYRVVSSNNQVDRLELVEARCLYLDEIIDVKFIN